MKIDSEPYQHVCKHIYHHFIDVSHLYNDQSLFLSDCFQQKSVVMTKVGQ